MNAMLLADNGIMIDTGGGGLRVLITIDIYMMKNPTQMVIL